MLFRQRCMMTEAFKPFYPAMCLSPRHLQRCRHGVKFKSFNCFCPTLYYIYDMIVMLSYLMGGAYANLVASSVGLKRFNPLPPNDIYIYIYRTAQLTSRRCILNIYSTNSRTEYFKRAAYSPFISLQNVIYFIMLPCLVPVLFTF
jgi:hypothetical protein